MQLRFQWARFTFITQSPAWIDKVQEAQFYGEKVPGTGKASWGEGRSLKESSGVGEVWLE